MAIGKPMIVRGTITSVCQMQEADHHERGRADPREVHQDEPVAPLRLLWLWCHAKALMVKSTAAGVSAIWCAPAPSKSAGA